MPTYISTLLIVVQMRTDPAKESLMSARFVRVMVVLAFCFLFTPSGLLGQGTDLGTIRGTVTDASGAVVAKAKVVVTDTKTNTSRSTATNGEGAYDVFGLSSGDYQVTVEAPGFEAKKITGIVLAGSAVVGVNAVLRVSTTIESMTVTADNKSRVYGAANPTFTATYYGFVNGDTAGSLTTPPALATTATAASPVGSYPITASGAAINTPNTVPKIARSTVSSAGQAMSPISDQAGGMARLRMSIMP